MVYLDQAVENGLPFWQETEYEAFLNKESKPKSFGVTEDHNKLAQNFLYSQIVNLKNKKVFADELATVSTTVKNVINMLKKTKPENRANFLESYCEYKYMTIVGSLHKLVEHFYR